MWKRGEERHRQDGWGKMSDDQPCQDALSSDIVEARGGTRSLRDRYQIQEGGGCVVVMIKKDCRNHGWTNAV